MDKKVIAKRELIYNIAKLHYIDKISQKKLADMYKVSTATISRFINEAEDLNIVDIKVHDVVGANRKIEDGVKAKYDLKKVIISSIPSDDENLLKKVIGKSAASLITNILEDNIRVGIAWGTSIYEMLKFLKYKHFQNIKVVDLIGNVGKIYYDISSSSLAVKFAKNFNAENYSLNSLAIVEKKETKDFLTREDEIKEVLDMTKDLDIAIISIGTTDIKQRIIMNLKFGRDIIIEAKNNGAVGNICLRFFDSKGNEVKTSFCDRMIGINFNDYKKINTKVCISGGLKKFSAIRAALRNNLVDILITDNLVGNRLLNEKEK